MSLARTHSIALVGVEGHPVEIESDIENGLPGLLLVGLPDTALREARDRIRAAIINSGEQWPQRRITVGLSPASLPKRGSGFDPGIAISVLAHGGPVPAATIEGVTFLGELGLDGQLRPVCGVLPAVAAAAAAGFHKVAVPEISAPEATLVPEVVVLGVPTLSALLAWLRGEPEAGQDVTVRMSGEGADVQPNCTDPQGPAGLGSAVGPSRSSGETGGRPDLADLLGQPAARRAAEICAAGGHHLSLMGPPGAGKTMLAERIPTILPTLDRPAALEVTAIHSVAGTLPAGSPLMTQPP